MIVDHDIILLPNFEIENLAEQNALRKSCDLPLLVLKSRTCMNCKRRFQSLGKRLCGLCIEEPGAVLSGYDAV